MSEIKKVRYFLILTFILSYALEFYVIFNGGASKFGIFMLTGLMWLPAISSLVIRFVSKDWTDIGFSIGSFKAHSIAFFTPAITSFLIFLLCHSLEIRTMGFPEGVPLDKILTQFTIIFLIGVFSALGEEIGWRGFLTPKAYALGWKLPTLKTGLIWAIWHLPIVAFGGYYKDANPLMIVALYTGMILALNIFMNWIRLYSGSVVVATMAHAFYNFFFQTFWFHLLFKNPGINEKYWLMLGGDMGAFVTSVFLAIAFFGYSKLGLRMKTK